MHFKNPLTFWSKVILGGIRYNCHMGFIDEFREVMYGTTSVLWENAFSTPPTWEDFVMQREEGNKTRPTRWDNEHFSITYEPNGSPNMSGVKNFQTFKQALLDVWGNRLWDEPAFIMSDTFGQTGGLGRHQDPCEQIHLNCIGRTYWTVEERDGTIKEYLLNPGDVIFLPTGLFHAVKTIDFPRAGIAYSIKTKDIN
jgi:hypothetical protein